ncbi:MAG: hypothetical protein AB4368_27890 [Xenococcaceae cyanobacterium]
MKLGKLLTVTALATGVALGTFVDSAEARRRTRYSSNGQDQEAEGATFNAFDRTKNEQLIIDSTIVNGVDTNFTLGFFEGAIEDYTATGGQDLTSDREDGFVEDINITPEDSPVELANFRASLSSDNSFILYEILRPEDNFVIEDFILELNGERGKRTPDGDFEFNDARDGSFPSLFVENFSTNRAINDISYILNENLLTATIPSQSPFEETPLADTLFLGAEEIPTSTNTIPESSTTVSLLILGALGTSFLLKCQPKNQV